MITAQVPEIPAVLMNLPAREVLDEKNVAYIVPSFIHRRRPTSSSNKSGWVVITSRRGLFADDACHTKYFGDAKFGDSRQSLQSAVNYLGSIYLAKARSRQKQRKDSWYPPRIKLALKRRPKSAGAGTWQFIVRDVECDSRMYVPIGLDGQIAFKDYLQALQKALQLIGA